MNAAARYARFVMLGCALSVVVGCAASPESTDEARTWSLPIQDWPGGLLSVSGASSDDVWVVGAATDGAPSVLRWRGDRWETVEQPSRGTLWWVHVVDADTVFVGGEHSLVARWRDGRFESMDAPGGDEETVFGVWARSAFDLYAVGGVAGRRGFVWHWNGVTWRALELPSTADDGAIFKVWGDAERVYVVGAAGRAFVRRGEGSFEPVETGGSETLLTVTGNSHTGEVVAVGGGSSAAIVRLAPDLRRDEPGLPFLQGVAFDADGEVWATGGRGTIVHRRRDDAWEEVDVGFVVPGQSLHAVWVDPDGGVWAVGGDIVASPLRSGVLLHGATERSPSPSAPPPPPAPSRHTPCEDDGDFVRCEGLVVATPHVGPHLDLRDRLELPVEPTDPVEPDPFPAPIGADAFGDPALGLGTGRESFVALRHGDRLRWEAGVQGGHHVWVSARLDEGVLSTLDDDARREVATRFVLTRRDGTSLGELTRLGGYVVRDGGWELFGNFSVLPTGIRPSRLDDEPLHLVVQVTLPTALALEREVWVRSACCD
jgi:hypothetical protein